MSTTLRNLAKLVQVANWILRNQGLIGGRNGDERWRQIANFLVVRPRRANRKQNLGAIDIRTHLVVMKGTSSSGLGHIIQADGVGRRAAYTICSSWSSLAFLYRSPHGHSSFARAH